MAKKPLNLASIRKEDKHFDEQFEIEVQGYTLKIDKHFRKSKINLLIAELVEKFDYGRAHNTPIESIFLPFSTLLIIRHFTSLQVPEDLEGQVEVLKLLTDNDFLEPILENLPKDQMNIVMEEVAKVTQLMNERIDEFANDLKTVELENKQLLTPFLE